MDDEIPFDLIKETEDRSWSLRLVEALACGAESNRGSIVEALSKVADRRTEQPLLALVLDPRKPSGVRKAASDVLFRIGSYETTEERAQWWASNDPVIVRHALLMTEPADAARVKTVAADPLHSLYHEAVRAMEFWEPPEFQRLVMRALDHKLLTPFFEQHSDARVRDLGTRAFSAWQNVDAILSNLYDRDFGVLKTSAYCSRFLEPNLEIAMRLRELIEDPNVMNNFAKEALESYVYHARNGETYDWLVELSKHDSRPSIRYTAVSELDSAETRSRIKELIPILEEPPANEWRVHCSILRACERSWLSQSTVEHLMSIDNLFLQTEIASSVVGA